MRRLLPFLAALAGLLPAADAGSLRLAPSEPRRFDFADQAVLPPSFGRGEFTLELWIKPDATFPVGPTIRASIGQLVNWTDADAQPYSAPGWWFGGNWLLDGHSRPEGFMGDKTRVGTFSLQLYGGGRVRWTFADPSADTVVGKVWAVQAWPANTTPSLLDGRWHHVACVRRWTGESGATLELWIDGRLVATQEIPTRTDMRIYWDSVPHPQDPPELGGWAWGAEVMTAWDYFFTQYEDYKGLVDELRFWDRARTPEELAGQWDLALRGDEAGLVGWFDFAARDGEVFRDRLDPTRVLHLHRAGPEAHAPEGAPLRTP